MMEATESKVNFEEKVSTLAQNIDRLKVLYENYFIGRERVAPQVLRQEVDRSLSFLLSQLIHIQNTALRFQVNSLRAKLNSYRRHWDRSMQQIEDGTYRKHHKRLQLTKGHKLDEPKKPTASKKKKTSNNKNPGIEALMNQFITAKKKCNEPTKGIDYNSFSKTITKQTSALKKRFKGKKVRFRVVIEKGKTKLKATPT